MRLIGILTLCLAHGASAAQSHAPFTDADLARLLAHTSRGIIYVWSPHMPYSVRGAAEARRAADALGLAAVLLLDPQAEAALAARARSAQRLPASALRRLRADALQRMGVTQHYPTAVLFIDGALDTQMLPGYTPPSGLRAFIRERLPRF